MKDFEAKYRTALDIAKVIFAQMPQIVFCGGTALNTFYLDYRYSEDLDIGYTGTNPKSAIETLLQQKGYSVSRTDIKIRDIVRSGNVEIKLDVFEYTPVVGLSKVDLEGISVNVPTLEEFELSKTASFLTREELPGLVRDAYDLYALEQEFGGVLVNVRKHRSKLIKRIVSASHNFDVFNEHPEAKDYVTYLLKNPIVYEDVQLFLSELREVVKK